MIPWRIRNFFSEHFPLFYHKMINIGVSVNDDQYWDDIYEREWDSPAREWPTKNKIIEQATSKTDVILDIACGTGSMLRYLKNQGYNDLHGTEISDLCVRRLREADIAMFKSVLPTIECEENIFDVIIASQILEHIIRRKEFMSEIKRVMKKGGQCFLFVPDNCLGPIDEPSHVIKFTEESLSKLLAGYFENYTITSIKDENFEMSILYAHIIN